MKRMLLTIGGVMQLLVTLMHVVIFRGTAGADIPVDVKDAVHIFNAAVLTTVVFFAYISFFEVPRLTGSRLGRSVLLFVSVFYLQRGLVELYLRGVQPVTLLLCLAIALVYALAAIPERPGHARPVAAEADLPASRHQEGAAVS